MIQAALLYENVVESAIAALLTSAGLTVFTTGDVVDTQVDRPRVEVVAQLGAGHLQWANPNKLPSDLTGSKVETAWEMSLHTIITTSADEGGRQDEQDILGTVRQVYLNLAQQLNGNLLTLHKINITKDGGAPRAIDPEKDLIQISLHHDLVLSLHESVWSSYTRITQDGSIRVSAVRVTN